MGAAGQVMWVLAIPSIVSVVGTVLALSVAILLLAGLALYVAFRVRETLHDEKGGGARAAKVAFLIGLLFLSGGAFYFFASGFAHGNQTQAGLTTTTSTAVSTTSLPSSSSYSTTVSGSSSSSASASSSSSGTSATSSTGSLVSMPAPSCQGERVTAGSTFTCEIYVYNQGGTTFSGATVVSSGDFAKFTFVNCTESQNGGPQTQVPTSGSTISVGNLAPGTTAMTLVVRAPSQSGQESNCVLTLDAPGLSQPISVTFSIQVTA